MAENLVTQVSQDQESYPQYEGSVDYESKIHLVVRGREFTITRDELMSLPESILLCLFPNGVFLDAEGQAITNLTEEDTVYVNFDPDCFEYILTTFGSARNDLESMSPLSPQVSFMGKETAASVLQHKPAIIVLREDLDYYIIPPVAGFDVDQMRHLKISVGTTLLEDRKIFAGLGYQFDLPVGTIQKLGPAEQHLLDMLCSSGFDTNGQWGSRSMEPSKCVISSLSLVRLQTGPTDTPPESPALNPVTSASSITSVRKSRSKIASLASSASRAASRSLSKSKKNNIDANQTKLLLFWRKPARKCWWSNQTININMNGITVNGESLDNVAVKVHIRRVWTLELSVIGVQ